MLSACSGVCREEEVSNISLEDTVLLGGITFEISFVALKCPYGTLRRKLGSSTRSAEILKDFQKSHRSLW